MSRKASNLWFKEEMKRRKYGNKKTWTDYKSYLLSNEWKKKRDKKIKLANSKCENCGSTKNLQVHHKTYERIFNEKMKDLLVLCYICHMDKHNLLAEEIIEQEVNKMALQ